MSATTPEIRAPVDPPPRKGPQRGKGAHTARLRCVGLAAGGAAAGAATVSGHLGAGTSVGCNTTVQVLC